MSSAGTAESAGSASQPYGTTPTLLARGTAEPFDIASSGVEVEADRATDVAVVRVVYQPGGTSGWHTHPGPTLVVIAKGSFTFFTEDCKGHRYAAGDAFVEEGPRHVGKLTNTGSTTGRIVLTVFAPPDEPDTTIPAQAPRGCD